MQGVPARGGDPARGMPMPLEPLQAEEHHGDPYPPSSRDAAGRGGKGQGVLARVALSAAGGLGVGIPRAGTPLAFPETKKEHTTLDKLSSLWERANFDCLT